jgi:hypothetical protein
MQHVQPELLFGSGTETAILIIAIASNPAAVRQNRQIANRSRFLHRMSYSI